MSTLYRRRRCLPDIGSAQGSLRARAERQAVNAIVQGTAADLVKAAMVAVDVQLCRRGLSGPPGGVRLLLQARDAPLPSPDSPPACWHLLERVCGVERECQAMLSSGTCTVRTAARLDPAVAL